MKLHTKYQRQGPTGFTREDFLSFSLNMGLCKTSDPMGGAIFDPKALVEVHYRKSYVPNSKP